MRGRRSGDAQAQVDIVVVVLIAYSGCVGRCVGGRALWVSGERARERERERKGWIEAIEKHGLISQYHSGLSEAQRLPRTDRHD